MAKPKPKFYVVWKGRKTGVFNTWAECQAQTNGFEGAQFKSFESCAEAETAFQRPYSHYVTQKSGANGDYRSAPAQIVLPLKERLDQIRGSKPILKSYSVDAACAGVPGPVEYRAVDNATGSELFHCGPYADGTNNIGEFLAIVHALRLLDEQGSTAPIYTDSRTALAWLRQKQCKTDHQRSPKNGKLFELIEEAEDWLGENSYDNPVLKWDTDSWGENPADFGRK